MDNGRYTKLRDRIAYEKDGRGNWMHEQTAHAEAVLAGWHPNLEDSSEALHAEAMAFCRDIMSDAPLSPDFVKRSKELARRLKEANRKRKADLRRKRSSPGKRPTSFAPSAPSPTTKASELVPTSKPKTAKAILTDRKLKSLKPAPNGKPYFVWDATVPGFGVRVMGKPKAPVESLGIMKRFPGSPHPTFGAFGRYGAMSLEEGRAKARTSLEQIEKGIDPRREEERQRRIQSLFRAQCGAARLSMR